MATPKNLIGSSSTTNGVLGTSTGTKGFSGVAGESTGGPGVSGHSTNSVGVDAKSDSGPAALRAVHAGEGPGVLAEARNNGVHGRSIGTKGFAGVFGESTGGPGVSAHSAHSVGVDLVVNGDVKLAGADLAEQFEVVGGAVGPGSVVVLAGDDRVAVSSEVYDRPPGWAPDRHVPPQRRLPARGPHARHRLPVVPLRRAHGVLQRRGDPARDRRERGGERLQLVRP
jgi:hypothetical protein